MAARSGSSACRSESLHIELARFGTELRDGALADEHFQELDRQLREAVGTPTAILDLSGVDFVGYAYARQTVVPCLQFTLRRVYPIRWLVLRCDCEDYAQALEGLALALTEHRLTAMLQTADRVSPFGYLVREQPFEGKRAQVKRQKMLNIMKLLESSGARYTNQIATDLELTLPNCNYLLAELEGIGLVERRKESSPSGGPIFLNTLAPPELFPANAV